MRLWSKDFSQDGSEDEAIPAPDGIDRILEYSMDGGEVPTGVTIAAEEDISIRGIEVREPGESWQTL